MNETRANRGVNPAVLLLIPAAIIVAKGVRRRRAMWESGWTPAEASGHGYGRHMGSRGATDAAASSFHLPPKIEWMLDAWHTHAHQKDQSSDPTIGPASSEPNSPAAPADATVPSA